MYFSSSSCLNAMNSSISYYSGTLSYRLFLRLFLICIVSLFLYSIIDWKTFCFNSFSFSSPCFFFYYSLNVRCFFYFVSSTTFGFDSKFYLSYYPHLRSMSVSLYISNILLKISVDKRREVVFAIFLRFDLSDTGSEEDGIILDLFSSTYFLSILLTLRTNCFFDF